MGFPRSYSPRLASVRWLRSGRSIARQRDARFVLAGTIKHSDIANPLDERAAGGFLELFENEIAFFAITDACANLDELMSTKCDIELACHRGRQARLANQYNRVAAVRQATQILSLFFGELHRGERWFERRAFSTIARARARPINGPAH